MKPTYSCTSAVMILLAIASPLQAQNLRAFEDTGRVETRAMVGVTIPLGGKSANRNTQPRFDLRLDTSRVNGEPQAQRLLNPLLQDRRDVRGTTLSLTFEQQPKVLMNGFAIAELGSPLLTADEEREEGTKNKRSAGQKVLRGLGFAGIAGLVVVGGSAGYLLIRCGEGSDCFDED